MGKVLMAGIASLLTAPVAAFPQEPTEYEQIYLYTASATFVAPENGWYQIELFGMSGAGNNKVVQSSTNVDLDYDGDDDKGYAQYVGGSGGGGAYSCSNLIKLNKGDVIEIVIDSTCTVTIHSTTGEVYEVMTCKSGGNGGSPSAAPNTGTPGAAGIGGVATGGNYVNKNGENGNKGGYSKMWLDSTDFNKQSIASVPGGASGHPDGNVGGASASSYGGSVKNAAGPALEGFCRISIGAN